MFTVIMLVIILGVAVHILGDLIPLAMVSTF